MQLPDFLIFLEYYVEHKRTNVLTANNTPPLESFEFLADILHSAISLTSTFIKIKIYNFVDFTVQQFTRVSFQSTNRVYFNMRTVGWSDQVLFANFENRYIVVDLV